MSLPNGAERGGFDSETKWLAADAVRRFMRHWICDRNFQQELLADADAAVASRGLEIEADALRIFWDPVRREKLQTLSAVELAQELSPLALIWLELWQRDRDYEAQVRRESAPDDHRFRMWRSRQIARCDLTFRSGYAKSTPHVPFAIELSKGCSVGCWFCGVEAPRLDGHFRYTPENAVLFCGVLWVLKQLTGTAAGKWSPLYWATDPFDNPDYERFCADFAGQFGQFPSTTTAKGCDDLARTKRLVALAGRHGNASVRMSILNLKMLNRYLSELSPSELAAVTFAPVNKQSALTLARAGRARRRQPGNQHSDGADAAAGSSIGCVSGFLLNMVEQNVRLISPCESSDRWPAGYFVFEEARFSDAAELAAVLEAMVERHMPLALPADAPLRFNSDLRHKTSIDALELSNRGTARFEGKGLSETVELIAQEKSASQIAIALASGRDAREIVVPSALQQMFEAGVLNAEPG